MCERKESGTGALRRYDSCPHLLVPVWSLHVPPTWERIMQFYYRRRTTRGTVDISNVSLRPMRHAIGGVRFYAIVHNRSASVGLSHTPTASNRFGAIPPFLSTWKRIDALPNSSDEEKNTQPRFYALAESLMKTNDSEFLTGQQYV